jgi:hypothetical protein
VHSVRNVAAMTSSEVVPVCEEPSFEFVARLSNAGSLKLTFSEVQPEVHAEMAGEFALLLYTEVPAKAGAAQDKPTINRAERTNAFIIIFLLVLVESALLRHLLN